jgi:hypothetical protein
LVTGYWNDDRNSPSTSSAFADCEPLSLVFNGHSPPLPHGPTGRYAP